MLDGIKLNSHSLKNLTFLSLDFIQLERAYAFDIWGVYVYWKEPR